MNEEVSLPDWRAALPPAALVCSSSSSSGSGSSASVPGADVEAVVSQLETMFHKMEADLSYVSRKLDTELAAKYAECGAEHLNPRRLIARVQHVRNELKALQTMKTEVAAQKEVLAGEVRKYLLPTRVSLRSLQARVGQDTDMGNKDESFIVDFLSSQGKTDVPASARASVAQSDSPADSSFHTSSGSGTSSFSSSQQAHSGVSAAAPTSSSAAQQPKQLMRTKSKFLAVTEQEFNSVSELVRGRVKLEDVNTVYEAIFNHFKKDKKCTAIEVKEMTNMGWRITGATGEAKLKVLRQLKIINMAKTGVTLM